MPAPMATASSGLTSFLGSLPNNFLTVSCTNGIRVEPPTRITSSTSVKSASFKAVLHGPSLFLTKAPTNDSNLALVILIIRCLGPDASAVMYGRLISVCVLLLNSILAFSEASFSRCSAILSFLKSRPISFLNSSTR